MNFIVFAIVDKKTGKVPYQGFFFSKYLTRDKAGIFNNSKSEQSRFLTVNGYDPDKYKVVFTHFKTLKKLRKAFWKAFIWGDK